MQERLQKLIAQAGIASRRKAEEMITSGRVSVNGKIASELGTRADPANDRVLVDGKALRLNQPTHHLLFYKPKGVVTTMHDPENRPSVWEYMKGIRERLYPVGRLDFLSEGLLVLTNDGDLANRMLRASSALPKVYWVKVAGKPSNEQLEPLRQGVYLDGRRTAPAEIRWLSESAAGGRERRSAGVYRTSPDNPWLEVTLIEGRNHQIRKMFQSIGHPVEKLKRVAIGRLAIGALKPGQMRPLTDAEVDHLRQATSGKARAARPSTLARRRPQPGGRRRERE